MPAPARARAHGAVVAFVLAAAVAASGCSGGAGVAQRLPSKRPPALATSSLAATASHPKPSKLPTPSEAALKQYRAFWRVLTPASSARASRRRPMLAPYTADPALSSLLTGIARDRAAGRVYYGTPRLRARVTAISVPRRVAVVRDCQDATQAGDKDASSGRLLTSGTSRTLVVSTMHLQHDGRWRVVFVTFPKQRC